MSCGDVEGPPCQLRIETDRLADCLGQIPGVHEHIDSQHREHGSDIERRAVRQSHRVAPIGIERGEDRYLSSDPTTGHVRLGPIGFDTQRAKEEDLVESDDMFRGARERPIRSRDAEAHRSPTTPTTSAKP